MKNVYKEDYSFKVTVVAVGSNGKQENCRNGHEIGDTHVCKYGCPGDFCSKSMVMLFPLLEAVRAGGDLSNLLVEASKHSGEFICPNGVVVFKLEAMKND